MTTGAGSGYVVKGAPRGQLRLALMNDGLQRLGNPCARPRSFETLKLRDVRSVSRVQRFRHLPLTYRLFLFNFYKHKAKVLIENVLC